MLTNQVHVCMDQPGSPDPDADFEEDARHICSCGSNFVYREGFNMNGYRGMDWWEAPALPVPKRSLRSLLIRPRQGSHRG